METSRWRQRFTTYSGTLDRLTEAMELAGLSELERNGLVQRFQFTIEIGWKTLKDFLVEQEYSFKPSPKDTFRMAQQNGFIDYGQDLIDGLVLRNLLSHDYDGDKFEAAEHDFRTKVYPSLKKLHEFLRNEYEKAE